MSTLPSLTQAEVFLWSRFCNNVLAMEKSETDKRKRMGGIQFGVRKASAQYPRVKLFEGACLELTSSWPSARVEGKAGAAAAPYTWSGGSRRSGGSGESADEFQIGEKIFLFRHGEFGDRIDEHQYVGWIWNKTYIPWQFWLQMPQNWFVHKLFGAEVVVTVPGQSFLVNKKHKELRFWNGFCQSIWD